jgi:hypothetical protein
MSSACDRAELAGAAFTNAALKQALANQGFTSSTQAVPAALGGGTVEVLSRIFKVP